MGLICPELYPYRMGWIVKVLDSSRAFRKVPRKALSLNRLDYSALAFDYRLPNAGGSTSRERGVGMYSTEGRRCVVWG